MIKLRLPVKDVYINQPFWVNYVNFYTNLWYKWHNWIDFKAFNWCPVYSAHSGVVLFAWADWDWWICVVVFNKELLFKTVYYHLKKVNVVVWQHVNAWTKVWFADNTWKYTTWDHLHFWLKMTDSHWNTINANNWFWWCIDPEKFFVERFDWTPIKNTDWNKSNAYHRYGRERTWSGFLNEKKVLIALIKYLKRMPTVDQINACTYWGWDREYVANDAFYMTYGFIKKDEYTRKINPFC